MTAAQDILSPQAAAILEWIAQGYTYEQILAEDPFLTYPDIFAAAQEALTVTRKVHRRPTDAQKTLAPVGRATRAYEERMAEIHQTHPRAYEKWSADEDEVLTELVRDGQPTNEIAELLHRQPSAIRSRIRKLGLDNGL